MVVMHDCMMAQATSAGWKVSPGKEILFDPARLVIQVGSGLTTLSIFTTKEGAVEKEARNQR